MNLRKRLGKQRHLEKATEAERLQKQAPPLHIRQVQSGDIGGTARGHTEAPLLGKITSLHAGVRELFVPNFEKGK